MKNIYKYTLVTLGTIFLLASCEDVATNVKLPPAEKQIVVQCFISPDDTIISALVTWSKPIIGTSVSAAPEYILNASVEISNGVIKESLLWNPSLELYQTSGSYKIEAGKRYFLTVSSPDGKSVSANCDVPFAKNNSLQFLKADTTAADFGGTMVNCTFSYKDQDPSVKNYFRLDGKADYDFYSGDAFVTGEFKDDTELDDENIYKLTIYNYGQNAEYVTGWLINCDYNYYQYHKTLQNAQMNFGFFTEPSIVYSNIEGGLGCFGAYYSYDIEADL